MNTNCVKHDLKVCMFNDTSLRAIYKTYSWFWDRNGVTLFKIQDVHVSLQKRQCLFILYHPNQTNAVDIKQ